MTYVLRWRMAFCLVFSTVVLSLSAQNNQAAVLQELKDGTLQWNTLNEMTGEKAFIAFMAFGIAPTDNFNDIKKAYRALALQYHPDKGGDKDIFQAINNANEFLTKQNDAGQLKAAKAQAEKYAKSSVARTTSIPSINGLIKNGLDATVYNNLAARIDKMKGLYYNDADKKLRDANAALYAMVNNARTLAGKFFEKATITILPPKVLTDQKNSAYNDSVMVKTQGYGAYFDMLQKAARYYWDDLNKLVNEKKITPDKTKEFQDIRQKLSQYFTDIDKELAQLKIALNTQE